MTRYLINIFLLTFFLCPSVKPQALFSVRDSSNFFTTDFNNDMNAANFFATLSVKTKIKSMMFTVSNVYNSSVTKFTENFSNDNNNLDIRSSYNFAKNFYAGAGATSKIVYSNQQLDLSNGYSNFFYTSLDYLPNEKFYVNTKFGIKDEKQIGVYNTGFSGILESSVRNLNISDFISSGSIYMSLDKFSERTNYNYDLNTTVDKIFSENARNSGTLRAFTLRTDFYTPATKSITDNYGVNNNIQSRLEDYVLLSDDLDYRFSRDFRIKIQGMFFLKNIKNQYKFKPTSSGILTESVYDNNIKENSLRAGFEAEYRLKSLSTRLNVSYTERTEDHEPMNTDYLPPVQRTEIEKIEKDKNNNSKTATAYMEVMYNLTNTHTLRVQGATSMLRYDTNSDINYDDRDELLLNGMITHRYYNFKNFLLETSFEYNSSILNYIFKEKSSNNNSNRVYKLGSYSIFKPTEGVTTKNFFQVLSNYTVYKYEDIVSQVQSFSYRQLYLLDSTEINITKKVYVGLFGELKLYEQGQFNEDNFSVKPLAYYDERTLGTSINYETRGFIKFYLGYRHYIRRFYTYERTDKILKRTQSTYGPFAGIVVNMRNNSSIFLLGGLDRVEVSDSPDVLTSENLVLKIIWNI